LDLAELSYAERTAALRATKLEQTRIKQQRMRDEGAVGRMDADDSGQVPLPFGRAYVATPNHPCGGIFGARANGLAMRALLEAHPVHIDPMSSLAGGWMLDLTPQRKQWWNPDIPYDHLRPAQDLYAIDHGIGAQQHFCPDYTIGLALGWDGLWRKVRQGRMVHPGRAGFYAAEEDIILGAQDLIRRHAVAAYALAEVEPRPELQQSLARMGEMNERLVSEPPATFLDALQWIAWFEMIARMYNGEAATGPLDRIVYPYYEREHAAGVLSDDEACFHLACFLVKDPHFFQVGGVDAQGNDASNAVSLLILDAAHELRIPQSITVRVHDGMDPELLRRSVEYCCTDRNGTPNWVGEKGLSEGLVRSGYPIEVARLRSKSGCQWLCVPGGEYNQTDMRRLNLPKILDVALRDMLEDAPDQTGFRKPARQAAACASVWSVSELWRCFANHLRAAMRTMAEGIDFHLAHMEEVVPELVLNLLMRGPLEKGRDISHAGTVAWYNIGIDAAGLATVADSFAAIEERVERERRLTWEELLHLLNTDFAGAEAERLMLASAPRYGQGGTVADEYATRIARLFSETVAGVPTPGGIKMIPGIFSWIASIGMGWRVGAMPNGRHAGTPLSHGANPGNGARPGDAQAPTALAAAVASVQCGYGNSCPLQLDLDPAIVRGAGGLEAIMALLRTHFAAGGTLVNLNVLDKEQLLAAHADPDRYPSLVIRVTGYSAYFASLSPAVRQYVVDRELAG
jgi:pyruvate-formate lyase